MDAVLTMSQRNGWEPSALVNWVALMGSSWKNATHAHGTPLQEILTMDELISNVCLRLLQFGSVRPLTLRLSSRSITLANTAQPCL